MAGFVVLVPGLIGLATGQLLLFPSLAPTAAIQANDPEDRSARFYNVFAGHVGGLASACAVVTCLGLSDVPSVFETHHLSAIRVIAAVLSVTLALFIEKALKAFHPTAASTTLLVVLGSFRPTLHDAAQIVVGVLIVASVGEVFRRVRLRQSAR